MFKKGNKHGKGRPPGALNKDTQNYLDFQLWFKKVVTDLEEIENPRERITIEMQVIEKLMTKIQNLPSSPAESVENANARKAMQDALINGPKEPVENPGGTDVTRADA